MFRGQTYSCAQGHHWGAPPDDASLPESGWTDCPVCGAPGAVAAELTDAANRSSAPFDELPPPPSPHLLPGRRYRIPLSGPNHKSTIEPPPAVAGYEILGELGR